MTIFAHDPALSRRTRDVGVIDKHLGLGVPQRHVRTHAAGRRCACGTVLSRYNPSGRCAVCETP